MLRFRPNVVIEATTPFAEDDCVRVRIGDVGMLTDDRAGTRIGNLEEAAHAGS
mgnify:CR=1 FL=1